MLKLKLKKFKKNDVDNLKEDQKQLKKNYKLILKTQKRFTIKKQNVLTKEIHKITLSSN